MKPSVFTKIITCLLTGLVCGAAFHRIAMRFLGKWIAPRVIIVLTIVILLTAVYRAFKWVLQKKQTNNQTTLAVWQALLRYGIAMDLILFGLQKYFGLQFSMPLGLLDLPFSSLSGQDLTFAYFAHSFMFVVLLGSFQIIGSVLLLFSRTWLVGTIVLLPIMTNIAMLNYCYEMDLGVFIHALILLAGLLYLLFSEYNRLVAFFFRATQQVPSVNIKNNLVKNSIRYSAIYIPVLLVAVYDFPEKHPALYGRYAVTSLQVNGQTISPASCKDSVLTIVYFDQNADCVFEYNDQNRRLIGNYHLDEATNKLTVAWRYPGTMHDSVYAVLSNWRPNSGMTLTGKMGNKLLQMQLVKDKK